VNDRCYTREEARALLPELRATLPRLREAALAMQSAQTRLRALTADGSDYGGGVVHDYLRALARFRELSLPLLERGIVISDLERGVVNFPAIVGGKEALLVWEEAQPDVECWVAPPAALGS
jgi:hypothetical protein